MQTTRLFFNTFALTAISLLSAMHMAYGQTDFCGRAESQQLDAEGYSLNTLETLDTVDCLGRNRDQNDTIQKIRSIIQDKEFLKLDLNSISAIDELSKLADLIQGNNATDIKKAIAELRQKIYS